MVGPAHEYSSRLFRFSFSLNLVFISVPPSPISNCKTPLIGNTAQTIFMCETFTNSYQLFEEIGRGRFGTISRCFSPARSDFFAVKVVDRRDLSDATDRECLENEAKIMNLVSPHPNIVSIVDVFDKDSDYLSIVMELCESYTLFDRIAARVVMSETEAAAYVKQLLHAVAHCHRLGVVHRDIKPENVMFDSRGTLKLGDFGSAVWLGDEEAAEATGIVGTPYYVAPEVLMGRDYGDKVDVWSCGVILYIMLSGMPPFYGDSATEIFEAVLRGNLRFPPRLFRSVSAQAKDLVRKMMCKDVSRRLSAEQALRHPWIVNGGATTSE